MTNIALAMKLNKSFESKVKNFVIMGGNMEGVGNTTSAAEFNFYADPEAAHVVLKRLQDLDIVKAKLVTWEVCRKSYYPWVRKIISGTSVL
jgi:purine nucleosidase